MATRGGRVNAQISSAEAQLATSVNEHAKTFAVKDKRGTQWLAWLLFGSSGIGFFLWKNLRSVAGNSNAAAARQRFPVSLRAEVQIKIGGRVLSIVVGVTDTVMITDKMRHR